MNDNENNWMGYEGMSEDEMLQAMWDEDGPPTLADENTCLVVGGKMKLCGRGGFLQPFTPDPDLDRQMVEAYEHYFNFDPY